MLCPYSSIWCCSASRYTPPGPADKGWVDAPGLSPALAIALERHANPARLMAGLLDGLVRMVRAGHEPSPYLLMRLTDGRVKAVRLVGQDAAASLMQTENEYGPASFAFQVGVEVGVDHSASHVRAEVRNLRKQGPAAVEQELIRDEAKARRIGAPRWLPQPDRPPQSAVESRNAAIFAASLGMTTGRLPNVDSSLLPSGASSCPVW